MMPILDSGKDRESKVKFLVTAYELMDMKDAASLSALLYKKYPGATSLDLILKDALHIIEKKKRINVLNSLIKNQDILELFKLDNQK